MAPFFALTVLALASLAAFSAVRGLWRSRAGPRWWVGLALSAALGAGGGIWCGFFCEYYAFEDLRVFSFPVPAARLLSATLPLVWAGVSQRVNAMDEERWLVGTDPMPMLEFLRATGKLRERKARLFACACARLNWSALNSASKSVVRLSEWHADGGVPAEVLHDATARAARAAEVALGRMLACFRGDGPAVSGGLHVSVAAMATATALAATRGDAREAFLHAADAAVAYAEATGHDARGVVEVCYARECRLFRDIMGNPFRPSSIRPSGLNMDVFLLAKSIYAKQAFRRMPILGRALKAAGCTDIGLIGHCESSRGLHARGCWALDLVLRKS